MKFLLCAINAKYIHSNPAVYSLRAYAGAEWKEHIEIAEYTINQYADDILADIYERQPDIIGFSCYIWNWSMVQALLVELNKILPDVPIWLGGPEVTYDADKVLGQFPMLAGVMVGEGEETFRELLQYYGRIFSLPGCASDRDLRSIAGLCLPDGHTAIRPLTNIDQLPFLYEQLDDFANRIIYYESSRGCPYRCSYCLSSIDKKVRLRDIAIVKKELQFFLDAKVAQVKFVDRTFNCNHQHAYAIWSYLLEHDNGVTNFHFEISADLLNAEEINLLRRMRPGLIQLEIGVQSANERTIRAINRTMDLKRLEQVVRTIKEGKNIHEHLDLIAGLPYEDYDSFANSFNQVYALESEQLQLGFLKVLKGSEMYEKTEEFGICYQDKPPYEVLYTKWLPYRDVLRLKKVEEMVERYYNSNQFTHTLRFLEKAFSSPFAMYEALADFYQKEGYFTNSPARSYRYQVLFSFAVKQDPGHEALYRELLTFDLFLRENAKSRPDFAPDREPWREEFLKLYQKEEQERRLLPHYLAYDYKQLIRMTHMESFHYPVWKKELSPQDYDKEEPGAAWFVLFDYQKRNPLTSDASVIVIERENDNMERQKTNEEEHC